VVPPSSLPLLPPLPSLPSPSRILFAREAAIRKTAINLLLINNGYEGPLDSFEEDTDEPPRWSLPPPSSLPLLPSSSSSSSPSPSLILLAREAALRKTAINLLLINDGYEGPLDSFEEDTDESLDGPSRFFLSSSRMSVKIFAFRLPDGNLDGSGFEMTERQSLLGVLEGGRRIRQQDLSEFPGKEEKFTGKEYGWEELKGAVREIVEAEAREQGEDVKNLVINSTHPVKGEHSDHRVAGKISLEVAKVWEEGGRREGVGPMMAVEEEGG
jgi:hypothetical protein